MRHCEPARPSAPTLEQSKYLTSGPARRDWLLWQHNPFWEQTSIVDLLKLLDLDSSLEARKGLAAELGCPKDKMGDSAQMNMWLHKTVLQKLAENGGNIPKELL